MMGKVFKSEGFILFFLLALVCYGSDSVPNIRIGISQLMMKGSVQGRFTITFKTALPDNVYNQMTAVSYINDFAPQNGIYLNASCPNKNNTQTNLRCSVRALNNNSNNIVYLTYVVSDESNFLCGTYTQDFLFKDTTDLRASLSIFVPANGKDIASFTQQINFLPYISGVNSADGNFSLAFALGEDDPSPFYQAKTQKIHFEVTISEFHQKNVSITFGFLIFDSQRYQIAVFQKLSFNPNSPQQNLLFAIEKVQSYSGKPPAESSPPRLLTVAPKIISGKVSRPIISVEEALRSSNIDKKKISIRPVSVNPEIFDQYSQADGVLVSSSIQEFISLNIVNFQENAIGVDNQVFNRLFQTNGFIIQSKASSIDQIYYFQLGVNGDLDPTKERLIPPVLYKSVVRWNGGAEEPVCIGVPLMVLQLVDYIQETYVYTCVKCPLGEKVNFDTKRCQQTFEQNLQIANDNPV